MSRVILVTGGGSGIGAGLASAYHARGAEVVIAGRTAEKLASVAARHPGMDTEVVDVADVAQVAEMVARVLSRHPGLDTVVNNAGVQQLLDFRADAPVDPAAIAHEVDVNLKGLIYVANAVLPALVRQRQATLIHVGSGLGFVPLAAAPVYSATKAAVHSFTVSLRRQLRGGPVRVVELIPPIVETELHRDQGGPPSRAMKLDAFVAAAMAGLDSGRGEIPIGLAKALHVGSRFAPGLFLNIVNKARKG
jgi:uncharacterized oxidoreductase